ncbi:alpha/beta fold hydrolase [Streptomyces sp. NPDC060035]|uniref:alpha/beta fold hydrolase n=1 Tax=Streptomyces sp. NPDC060035 TaxID=3347044 RepID=UPI0036952AAA
MKRMPYTVRLRLLAVAPVLPMTALISVGTAFASGGGGSHTDPRQDAKPTVVLVHGAWADASGWNAVTQRLQAQGYPVVATANPLRSLSGDSAYLAARLKAIQGPIVLVGHSYGGAVITNAATGNPNVKSLVYVAAFVPDVGEGTLELTAKYPGSRLTDDPTAPIPTALNAVPLGGGPTDVDLYIKPEKYSDVFLSNRLNKTTAGVLAVSQRPAAPVTGSEPTKTAAWKTIPSWALVAGDDRTIGTDNVRYMAKRATSHTVEVADAPHGVMLTNPEEVTDIIRQAAGAAASDAPGLADTGSSLQSWALAGGSALALSTGVALVLTTRRFRARGSRT